MYQITVSRNTFDYKYECGDENSILYLFRRLKEFYEDNKATNEYVTMEIKKGGKWFLIENNKLIESEAETKVIIADWGLQ